MTSPLLTDESPLNWCHMPPEIKVECIKHCGVKERLLLRATARTERELVDFQKPEIPVLRVSAGTYQSTITTSDPNTSETTELVFPWTKNRPAPCLEHLLKTSRVGTFQLVSNAWQSVTRDFVGRNPKFPIEVFQHVSSWKKDLVFFLNSLDSTKIRWIQMDGDDPEDLPSMEEMVKIPSVINCTYWQISNYNGVDSASVVAQAWLDMDAKIGMRFQVMALEEGSLEDFVEDFEDRIVFRSPTFVRIHTADPKKHISLELGYSVLEAEHLRGGIVFKRLEFLRLLMVSAGSRNSDEEDWAETVAWMNDLSPGYEFPDEED